MLLWLQVPTKPKKSTFPRTMCLYKEASSVPFILWDVTFHPLAVALSCGSAQAPVLAGGVTPGPVWGNAVWFCMQPAKKALCKLSYLFHYPSPIHQANYHMCI